MYPFHKLRQSFYEMLFRAKLPVNCIRKPYFHPKPHWITEFYRVWCLLINWESTIIEQANELVSSPFEPHRLDTDSLNSFDTDSLNSFRQADQTMIEDWCGEELRARIANYVDSLGDVKK